VIGAGLLGTGLLSAEPFAARVLGSGLPRPYLVALRLIGHGSSLSSLDNP
jgi:hypothetical protein